MRASSATPTRGCCEARSLLRRWQGCNADAAAAAAAILLLLLLLLLLLRRRRRHHAATTAAAVTAADVLLTHAATLRHRAPFWERRPSLPTLTTHLLWMLGGWKEVGGGGWRCGRVVKSDAGGGRGEGKREPEGNFQQEKKNTKTLEHERCSHTWCTLGSRRFDAQGPSGSQEQQRATGGNAKKGGGVRGLHTLFFWHCYCFVERGGVWG